MLKHQLVFQVYPLIAITEMLYLLEIKFVIFNTIISDNENLWCDKYEYWISYFKDGTDGQRSNFKKNLPW